MLYIFAFGFNTYNQTRCTVHSLKIVYFPNLLQPILLMSRDKLVLQKILEDSNTYWPAIIWTTNSSLVLRREKLEKFYILEKNIISN